MIGLPDAYVLRARVAPVILAGIPIFELLIGEFIEKTELKNLAILSIVGVAVVTLFSQFGRERGKKIEQALFTEWKGIPTTVMLRHSDQTIDPITKTRIHKGLTDKISDLQLPSPDDEEENPSQADITYESAVFWLRSKTKNKIKFPRLHEENTSYGFRRNLLGLKPFGLLLSFIILGIQVAIYKPFSLREISIFATHPYIISQLVFIVFFSCIVTKNWVKDAAKSYAFALLNATESL